MPSTQQPTIQQNANFLPLTPIRSNQASTAPGETSPANTNFPSVAGKDVIVPFNRGRADSASSTASANAYLWLSVDRE
ncbi:hypothetical protein Q7P37_004652 [Cladosporium fusiforme]